MRLIDADDLIKAFEALDLMNVWRVRKMEMTKEEHLSKALDLIIQWAIECNFGYDNIPEEYEHYKDEIKDMGYAEGLRYIVMKESFYDKPLYQRETEE